jgi:hypothetical protein
MPLQIRRGTDAEREAMNVPLAPGELLYITDDKRLFVGDGTTLGGIQITGYTDEDAQDAVAALILSGDHNNIAWSYNDTGNKLSSSVDLSSYVGEISADGFRGNLIGDDSTILVKALNSSINLDGTVKGNIIPDLTEIYDLGSNLRRFKDLYLSGNSLYLGDAQITATGSIIELPAGSLIGGQPIGIETEDQEGFFLGDVQGSVFGDDSSIIINGITGDVTANTITSTVSSSDQFIGAGITVDLQFTDQVQERLTIRSQTDGTLADQGLVLFRTYRGTDLDNPVDTVADDYLGGFTIDGYNNGDYVNAALLFAKWDSDADFNFASPTSTITIATGNNSNSFPNFLTFNGQGVLNAPVIKASSYATGSLPPAPEAGWIVFDSTVQKFKGYVDDTGIAAGGPPNSTPGWVDLN